MDDVHVSYVRTGKRRYAVHVHGENAADVVMDPAPGYDDHIPHDLVHLFVETRWGLRDAIFGQLAVGGEAASAGEVRTGLRTARPEDRRAQPRQHRCVASGA